MAVTWTVAQCDYKLTQAQGGVDYVNVIDVIHWRANDEDDKGNTGTSYGSCGIDTSDLADGWIAYADLTEAQAITMAKNALGAEQVTSIETSIANEISAKANPTTGTGVPW
jgi:hypothetical protein|tara:strand:+ start:1246 stop:1578 length:333 start_codon:yes stop_codon:yes gene_type:complete